MAKSTNNNVHYIENCRSRNTNPQKKPHRHESRCSRTQSNEKHRTQRLQKPEHESYRTLHYFIEQIYDERWAIEGMLTWSIWVTRWCFLRSRNCLPFESTRVQGFYGVCIAHLLVFCVCFLSCLCLVPNVARVSALSILDCPFDLLWRSLVHLYFKTRHILFMW
jgi:hypothetical protein